MIEVYTGFLVLQKVSGTLLRAVIQRFIVTAVDSNALKSDSLAGWGAGPVDSNMHLPTACKKHELPT